MDARLTMLQREMTGQAARDRLTKVGMAVKGEVADAVRADIGDTSMSGWPRKGPVEITGRFEVLSATELSVQPVGKALGPMRVLESGRQAYQAGDRRRSGSYRSKKTGDVRQKSRTVSRNTGATKGKGTWSDAVDRLVRRIPNEYHGQMVRTYGKLWKG